MSNGNAWESAPKANTTAGIEVFNKSQRDAFRKTAAFRNRNRLWNNGRVSGVKFNQATRVGNMSELIEKVKPETHASWSVYYLNNIVSWEQMQKQAEEWRVYCLGQGENITAAEALAEHIIHVIDQTFEGWHREEVAATNLASHTGKQIGRPSYRWDKDFAIDLIELDEVADDGWSTGYQIKPASFFRGNSNQGLLESRKQNAEKHAKAEELGKKVWFIDGDEIAKGNVVLIHWSDLISEKIAA